jgi:four helix bundle protein
MDPRELKERCMHFAVNVGLWRTAPAAWPAQRVSDQVFRSATSVAANYHAACRARSRREFIAKLGIVVEEAEETVFWLEFAARVRLLESARVALWCRKPGSSWRSSLHQQRRRRPDRRADADIAVFQNSQSDVSISNQQLAISNVQNWQSAMFSEVHP